METLTINITPETTKQTIYLNNSKESWITVENIPSSLQQYATDNYNTLFSLHPPNVGKIIAYGYDVKDGETWKEMDKKRYHASYLNTPKYSKDVHASFMFSGYDESKNNDDLPIEFQPFFEYMKTQNDKYNQVGINWYENAKDYIPAHCDCDAKMIDGYEIAIMNFNETGNHDGRTLSIKPKMVGNVESVYENVNIILTHGLLVKMCGKTQSTHKHGVWKVKDGEHAYTRIGMSFRQFGEENVDASVATIV